MRGHPLYALIPYIIPGLWLAWIAYWLIAAARTKPTTRQESPTAARAHILPLVLAVIIEAAPAPRGWPSARFPPPSFAWFWLGAALTIAGLAFAVWARLHLAGNWSGRVTVKQNHELIQTGPYCLVRHPIYTGLILAFLGSAIALGQWRGLLAAALMFYAFNKKRQVEESYMTTEFPQAYPAYRARVPALIPFLW